MIRFTWRRQLWAEAVRTKDFVRLEYCWTNLPLRHVHLPHLLRSMFRLLRSSARNVPVLSQASRRMQRNIRVSATTRQTQTRMCTNSSDDSSGSLTLFERWFLNAPVELPVWLVATSEAEVVVAAVLTSCGRTRSRRRRRILYDEVWLHVRKISNIKYVLFGKTCCY